MYQIKMKMFILTIIITFIMLSDSIPIRNGTDEFVEIIMDNSKPERCLLADYRGIIVEEIVSVN